MSLLNIKQLLVNSAKKVKTKLGLSSLKWGEYESKLDEAMSGITPSGSLQITENGTYDVTDKAEAVVNVPVETYYMTKYGVWYPPNIDIEINGFKQYEMPSNLYRYADCLVSARVVGVTSIQGGANANPFYDSSIVTLELPSLQSNNTYIAAYCEKLQTVILGSVGVAVNSLYGGAFRDCTNPNLTITIYVDAATLADIPEAVSGSSPFGAVNATIIYKNSTTGEVITA